MITKKDPSLIQSYLEDSSNLQGGFADSVVFPQSLDEVSAFLREADKNRIPVTISGAGTGTSGGRVPMGGVVLSTEKLNRIKGISREGSSGFAACECGVLIQDLKKKADTENLFYTYDPTEQTAFVGGTVATNASGARSFKYGSTRKTVHSLTLALADGAILTLERGKIREKDKKIVFDAEGKEYVVPIPSYNMPPTKSSAGYYAHKGMDLIDLFIGQEGTLCCILEATLKLNKKPDDILSCYAFFKAEEDALSFADEARPLDALAIEYFDENTLNLLREKYSNIPDKAHSCIFFEQETDRDNEDQVIETWQKLMSKYGVSSDDTWVAMDENQRQGLIDKRHSLGESMNEMTKKNHFPKVSTDLAVPLNNFHTMMDFYNAALKGLEFKYYLFGHIGDCHMHLTLFPTNEKEFKKAKEFALTFIKKSVSLGGTVSAEHGIGKLRREYLKVMYGERGIEEMIRIKKALDPNMILGKGNIFRIKEERIKD